MSNNCSTSSVSSQNVTTVAIAYCTLYGFLLMIVSAYSFNSLMKYNDKYIKSPARKRFKIWCLDVWTRRQCYVPMIVHIFNQMTDIAVAIQFYILAKSQLNCNGLNIWYLFIATILSMCAYRIISSYLIYQSTRSINRVILQILDLELLRAVYVNYICNKTEPCNPQRWITAVEAVLQSSPQAVIQLIYLIRTGTFSSSTLVVISLVSSLWSIIANLMSDDTVIVTEKAQRSNFNVKCPDMMVDTLVGITYIIIWLITIIIDCITVLVCISLICVCSICSGCFIITFKCFFYPVLRYPYFGFEFKMGQFNINDLMDVVADISENIFQLVPYLNEKLHLYLVKQFKIHERFTWISLTFILRVCWRVISILSHILLMSLIWIVIGGIALIIKVGFELLCVVVICTCTKHWEFSFAVIATVVSTTTENMKLLSIVIYIYRIVTNIIFIILISVWLFVNFECWNCTQYSDRQSPLVFAIFIFVWIAIIASPVCLFWLNYFEVFKSNVSSSRNVQQMIVSNNYDGILEMQLYMENYDIYDEIKNKTLLMLAMTQNKPAVVLYLSNKNDTFNQVDSDGRNILDYCLQLNSYNNCDELTQKALTDIFTKILKLHPNMKTKEDFTVFLLACYHGNLEMVEKLIHTDPNVLDNKSKDNINGLVFAKLNNCASVVECLEQKYNMKDNVFFSHAEYISYEEKTYDYYDEYYDEKTDEYYDEKTDEYYDEKTQLTQDQKINVLDYIVAKPTLAQTSILLNIYQQNEQLRSTNYYTPFLCAVRHGNLDCVKKLIAINENVLEETLPNGNNAANVAVENEHTEIANYLRQNHQVRPNYHAVEQIKYKFLLLGAGEVGKSTILKQLRMLHGRQFDQSELLSAKPHLTQNTIEAMRTLAIYSDIFADQGKNTRVNEDNKEIRDRVARMSDKQKFTREHYEDFSKLWHDEGIRRVLDYRNQFQLIDTCEYLLEHMIDYYRDDYIPTFQDLIHCYQRTTGVNKIKFAFEDKRGAYEEIYEIFDTGGQKNERRKWMHFFDNTAAVIFVANLTGYNELLWEDNRNNRMREDIGLFRGIVNLDVFKDTHMILFLNKYDLFARKVGKYPVKEHFPDFDGEEKCEQIIEFFKQKFRDQIRYTNDTYLHGHKKEIHIHITCATDTSCIKKMFNSCRNITLKMELQIQGFL